MFLPESENQQAFKRPRVEWSHLENGITQVTCAGNQFAEIIQSAILEVEEKFFLQEVPALTGRVWPFLESLWTHPPSFL